ncbi:MAG: YetF domain-containing protein [Actinomycetota bacterium]|nr:YetF domain-containing protein [Actinomycetota bacterium]
MWFDDWSDIVRVLVVGTAAYVGLVAVLRVSGKRTLAKLNAFDLVVTVAFGSTLATILLSSDVSYAEGVTALVLLAVLQFVAAMISSRLRLGRAVITARPTLLLRDGAVLDDVLLEQRISADEIRQVVRASGAGSLAAVAAVVLETDGTLSVISADRLGDGSALGGLSM